MKTVGLLAASAVLVLGAHGAGAATACCKVKAGEPVMVELADPLSTKTAKSGDTFALKLSEPLVINHRIVLQAGATGVGQVVEAAKPGLGGKPAKLVVAAQYLVDQHGRHIPLRGLQLSAAGKGRVGAAAAVGAAGIAFAPLGLAAFAIRGGDVELPAGAQAMAKVSKPLFLASIGPAPKDFESGAAIREASLPTGVIPIGKPPAGKAQIVFFRPKSLLGTGQWFNVREDGKALGKLTNGAYFVETVEPGDHIFTASTEPEFKDKLTLRIDPGETYFVEGGLTHGVIIGAAELSPSDEGVFNKASKALKPAEGPGADQDEKAQAKAKG